MAGLSDFSDALTNRIIGVESGGNPNAQNPNSSAGGLGQFIDSTWLSTLAKYRPDLIEGKSRDDVIALKSDPNISREMTAAYAQENGNILTKAGYDPTPGNTYLAHFAGPQGAVNVLRADPNTPVSSVLDPGAVRANPFLKNMTAADLQAWANRKMGGGQGQQPAQSSAGSPAPSFNQPPQQVASLPAYGWSPGQGGPAAAAQSPFQPPAGATSPASSGFAAPQTPSATQMNMPQASMPAVLRPKVDPTQLLALLSNAPASVRALYSRG